MRAEHIGALIAIADPRVSPDGLQVVDTEQTVELEHNRYASRIWITTIATGERRPLTDVDHRCSLARFAPNGESLAYVSSDVDDDDALPELRVVQLATGTSRAVCQLAEPPDELEWSPDGARLAFVARDPDRAIYGEPGTKRKPNDMPARRIEHFYTRLDGEDWIVDRPNRVFVVAAAGGEPQIITGGPHQASGIAWSPDSEQLAFCSARHDTWDRDLCVDLWVVNLATHVLRCLTPTDAIYSHPSWGDVHRIAVLGTPEPSTGVHHTHVAVIDVVSASARVVTGSLDRNCAPYPGVRAPIWNGDALRFTYEDAGRVAMAEVPADGSGKHEPVVDTDGWVLGFDQQAGVLVYTAATFAHLPELFVHEAAGARQLTDATPRFEQATGTRVALPHPFVARSADGTEHECWAIKPEGDGPFPTLLNIHGGPYSQYGHKFFDEFQLQIGAGFAVVFCNPRGSSGRDEAWARAIHWPAGWGSVDYDDVMACIDTAIAEFDWIDEQRLGVLGGSYGGYLTSWIIGHTQRFGAACSERSVNNLITEEYNSDIATSFITEVGASPLDDPDDYARCSPITFVRAMHTPLLIVHSENDLRCPINQAEELFVALRLLGRTPEFWRFPGEGHELSRSGAPKHRVQRAEIILDFFARQLARS